MPIKKSELYSSLWKICDELRGGMDTSQCKDYVLVLLFVKYVSDKHASQKNYLLDVPANSTGSSSAFRRRRMATRPFFSTSSPA
jgi:type I restriction-modification system DNA methylase subunit